MIAPRALNRVLALSALCWASGMFLSGTTEAASAYEICRHSKTSGDLLSPGQADALLGELEGSNRWRALRCLVPNLQDRLSSDQVAVLLGDGEAYRSQMICTVSKKLRVGIGANEAVHVLGGLEGSDRWSAVRCLEPNIKFADGLTGEDLDRIAGSPLPYRPQMLCTLADHVQDDLPASGLTTALGQLSGSVRWRAIRCLAPKLAGSLHDNELELIVGDGDSYRGRMYAALESKSINYIRAAALRDYQGKYREGRFLSEGDGPGWLGGQCIAWAKELFMQSSGRDISSISFGTAAKIPQVMSARGFEVVTDATKPKVGAMVVWVNNGAGHVGIVTRVKRNPQTGTIEEVVVSEANWGTYSAAAAAQWALSLETAKQQFVTSDYGVFRERRFNVAELGRNTYRFAAYIYP